MQLPTKQKTVCCNFTEFLESILNFEHFEKKNGSYSLTIFEMIDSERRGYLNA